MRRRVGLQKAESAVVDEPTHRLTDIEVKEVSVVDRPANRRKFLVVKRSTGPEKDSKDTEAMKISPVIKAELTEKMKGILAAADTVSKSLETAETVDGAVTPQAIQAALDSMGKLLAAAIGGGTKSAETEKAFPPKKKAGPEDEEDAEDDDESEDDAEEAPDEEEDAEEEEAAADDAEEEKDLKKKKNPFAKAGRKMARGRRDRLRAAVGALEALLGEVDDEGIDAPDAPASTEKSAKKVRAAKADDGGLTVTLRELADSVTLITKAMAIQKSRIDQLASSSGESRQVSTEKSSGGSSDTKEVSWPLDMNRPITSSNTPVEKSFFDA